MNRFKHYFALTAAICAFILTEPAMAAPSFSPSQGKLYSHGDITVTLLPAPKELWSSSSYGYGTASDAGYRPYRFVVFNHSAKKYHNVKLLIKADSNREVGEISKAVKVSPNSATQVTLYQPALTAHYFELELTIDGSTKKINMYSSIDHSSTSVSSLIVLISKASKNKLKSEIRGVLCLSSELDVTRWGASWLDYSRFSAIIIDQSEVDSLSAETTLALKQYAMAGGVVFFLDSYQIPDKFRDDNFTGDKQEMGFGRYQSLSSDLLARRMSSIIRDAGKPRYLHKNINDAAKRFPIVENFGVPVGLFVVLIIVFAIVIGPILLIWLSKIKKRIWLLWIVPMVSAVLCIVILIIAILAEGFSPSVRTKSLTYLDQESGMYSTVGWLGIYAAILPGEMTFSMQTVVDPQTQGLDCTRNIDFTGGVQHLNGWSMARMPMYLFLRKCEMTKKRVVIAVEAGSLTVTNGLGSDIESLIYVDNDGKWWKALNLPAGKKTTLTQTSKQYTRMNLRDVYNSFSLRQDEGRNYSSMLRPGTYLATLKSSAFMPNGLGDKNLDWQSNSIVLGRISRGGVK